VNSARQGAIVLATDILQSVGPDAAGTGAGPAPRTLSISKALSSLLPRRIRRVLALIDESCPQEPVSRCSNKQFGATTWTGQRRFLKIHCVPYHYYLRKPWHAPA